MALAAIGTAHKNKPMYLLEMPKPWLPFRQLSGDVVAVDAAGDV